MLDTYIYTNVHIYIVRTYVHTYIHTYIHTRMWTRTRICGNRKTVAFPQDQSGRRHVHVCLQNVSTQATPAQDGFLSFLRRTCSLYPLEQESQHSTYFSFLMFRYHRQSTTVDGKSPLPYLKKSIKISVGLEHW